MNEEMQIRMEEYKMLRQEMIGLVDETRKLEVIVVGAIAAMYAWLASNPPTFKEIWCLGPLMALIGIIRAWGLFLRMNEIRKYLLWIEKSWPKLESNIKGGWETYLDLPSTKAVKLRMVAYVFWGSVFGISIVLLCFLK